MVTLVVYDIGNNARRKKTEQICKDNGLDRVQASVFRGDIDVRRRNRLVKELTTESTNADDGTWDVQIYFISRDDFASHIRLCGEGPVDDLLDTPEVIII